MNLVDDICRHETSHNWAWHRTDGPAVISVISNYHTWVSYYIIDVYLEKEEFSEYEFV